MIETFKKYLYFPLAYYFRFFAAIKLRRWHPRIVVVTGSNGKTTLLHLIESQIGGTATYSHHANSSYGIPFDILGLQRKTLLRWEWVSLFLKAPFLAFSKLPKERIYIVESDVDRPGEGKFLAEFLRPEVTVWVSIGRTHSMNFDALVSSGEFSTVEEAIAYEYGYFLAYCSTLAVLNGDSKLQLQQKERTQAKVTLVTKDEVEKYAVTKAGTTFTLDKKHYTFPFLLPQEVGTSLIMCKGVVQYLNLSFDSSFLGLTLPPGRGSVFAGVKKTTLIDSTYNANLGSIKAMLSMFAQIPEKKKWVVIGDMLELGEEEKEEHEKLAESLSTMEVEKIMLVGSLVGKYTYPQLKKMLKHYENVVVFQQGKDAVAYLKHNLTGGETILFKGSQSLFLEGLIEQVLEDKKDVARLPRRGKFWEDRRERMGY